MTLPDCSATAQWYREGRCDMYLRTMKSAGRVLDLLEYGRPAGDMFRPALPEIVLYQDLRGGGRVSGNLGGGHFDVKSERGALYLAAPDFAVKSTVKTSHQVLALEIRALVLPIAQWQEILDVSTDGQFLFDFPHLCGGTFDSPVIQSALRTIWALCCEEGPPSRLLARAAGCEILAELCRLGGAPFKPVRGGLAPWAERRCLELMRARLSEDISLDELAAEARLSSFHFARMFKQSVGVPPRVYLTQLRIEKACELLERTDLPVTEIAQEVGYSTNQVLARVFTKNRRMSPTDYRRAVRDPTRPIVR